MIEYYCSKNVLLCLLFLFILQEYLEVLHSWLVKTKAAQNFILGFFRVIDE